MTETIMNNVNEAVETMENSDNAKKVGAGILGLAGAIGLGLFLKKKGVFNKVGKKKADEVVEHYKDDEVKDVEFDEVEIDK